MRKNCSSDLKNLQILGLQSRISKVVSRSLEQYFLTVDQNNFGNKIQLRCFQIHWSGLFPMSGRPKGVSWVHSTCRQFIIHGGTQWTLVSCRGFMLEKLNKN